MSIPRILNFGSCCIDNVYQVPFFVKPGETLPCTEYQIHAGGKGLNQSLALAHAGAKVIHAGKIGKDGLWIKSLLKETGADVTHVNVVETPSGHAIIQVTPQGDNAIVIYGGANRTFSHEDIRTAIDSVSRGDFLLIQNETNLLPEVINAAHEKGLRIVFNAAPMTADVSDYPLQKVEMLIVNEVEGEALTQETIPEKILDRIQERFPNCKIVLTLGEQGAIFAYQNERIRQPATKVNSVDATGAGDTFTGYFLANYANGENYKNCLQIACTAAAICVTRPGAASSIPKMTELG